MLVIRNSKGDGPPIIMPLQHGIEAMIRDGILWPPSLEPSIRTDVPALIEEQLTRGRALETAEHVYRRHDHLFFQAE